MTTFYFAWVNAGVAFNPAVHNVVDEEVFAFELKHAEGEFAELTIDIKNPRIGLLNVARKRWLWFSQNEASVITPLFYGRLIGVPQQMQNEVVRLVFLAKPGDFEAAKSALAETLKVEPYWDPMWLSEEGLLDPDSVLEARPALWHIDRTTHAVTISNVVIGEAATLDVGGSFFYDSLSVGYSSIAARSIKVQADVNWEQLISKPLDIARRFPKKIESYTGQGLVDAWPTPGTRIGSFWEVQDARFSSLTDQLNNIHPTGFITQDSLTAAFQRSEIKVPKFEVRLAMERGYSERVAFELFADVQPLLTDPGEEEIEVLQVSANADHPVDGSPPLPHPDDRRFMATDRGKRALKYLLLLARARLLHRARAIDVSFSIPFQVGLNLSCRHNATIADPRLPGGTATGKVKSYSLSLDGDTGEYICRVLMGCTIGKAGTVSINAGDPTYVQDGYVNPGYVYRANESFFVLNDELTFEDYSEVQPEDDQIVLESLNPENAVVNIEVINDADTQIESIGAVATELGLDLWTITGKPDGDAVGAALNEVFTSIRLTMFDFGAGPFLTPIPIVTSQLKIPKTIDLEAPAS